MPDINFRLWAKLEAFNPGGSMKDRPALGILRRAMETGEVRQGTVVIESSSGNMGVGLAQACAYLGLKFICVVDPKTTKQHIKLLEAYGTEVDMVDAPDPGSGEYLVARINRVQSLLNTIENSFWPNQYGNPYNALAHHQTMREIMNVLDDQIDYVFCATSTCGTLRGCVDFVRGHGLMTKVFAVDAVGSVIFGGPKQKRLIPGHGAAMLPELFRPDLADGYIHVTDPECVRGCRNLLRHEAILAGGSSGAIISAVERVKHRLAPGSNCVVILPDRGERYLDTIYSDEWVRQHFGEIGDFPTLITEDESCVTATF
jgi:cysteine synthase A